MATYDHESFRAPFEREDRSVFFCPFCKLKRRTAEEVRIILVIVLSLDHTYYDFGNLLPRSQRRGGPGGKGNRLAA
jgi:hypothetical protein